MRPDGSRIEAEGSQWVFGGGQQAPSPPARGLGELVNGDIVHFVML